MTSGSDMVMGRWRQPHFFQSAPRAHAITAATASVVIGWSSSAFSTNGLKSSTAFWAFSTVLARLIGYLGRDLLRVLGNMLELVAGAVRHLANTVLGGGLGRGCRAVGVVERIVCALLCHVKTSR